MNKTKLSRSNLGQNPVSNPKGPAHQRDPMESRSAQKVRVLTVSDVHQRKELIRALTRVVETHKPDVVAVIGDVLEAFEFDAVKHLSATECAAQLAELPVQHLLFLRGNHEDLNWGELVCTWPYSRRPLVALYGTATTVGSLTIVGFPCHTGSEFCWCAHLESQRDLMVAAPDHYRAELPVDYDAWLPQLLRSTGPAGRTVWLLHEPPMANPLAMPDSCNPEWARAVERFQPLLTISGHHHRPKAWHSKIGRTLCVNVGQDEIQLRFCVNDFHFSSDGSALPTKIEVVAYPTNERLMIQPGGS